MTDDTTNTEQSHVAADCPNERIVMRDLYWEDITYANSFPANVCKHSCVVVQIKDEGQGVVLYTCKHTGKQARAYLPLDFAKKYTSDIYVFGA